MGLKDKASKIDFASLPGSQPAMAPAESGPAGLGNPRPKTAPGLMMAQAGDQRSEILRENESLKAQVNELTVVAARVGELQDELKGWDGARATRLIDPRLIVRSRWANRDPRHFASPEFADLKAEISSAGGNVQPVKVRPASAGDDGQSRYELVYGHRRHEACAQLGLPVLALVENLGDAALFAEMDRENRSRKDLSAWEQGVMYQRALQEGLFPSNRKLAEAVGADLSNVGKALALASLPEELVSAFSSPLDLQYRWAKPLRDAWDADAQAVRRRAQELAAVSPKPSAKDVFDRLVEVEGQGGSTVPPPPPIEVQVGGRRAAVVEMTARGAALVTVEAGLLTAGRLPDLAAAIERFLEAPKTRRK
jgi:ParB family transcriptional regulator, chromosome partitioning protein